MDDYKINNDKKADKITMRGYTSLAVSDYYTLLFSRANSMKMTIPIQ
jgi:hypothetical protein